MVNGNLWFRVKAILKGIWQFCSYLFVPRWGRTQRENRGALNEEITCFEKQGTVAILSGGTAGNDDNVKVNLGE